MQSWFYAHVLIYNKTLHRALRTQNTHEISHGRASAGTWGVISHLVTWRHANAPTHPTARTHARTYSREIQNYNISRGRRSRFIRRAYRELTLQPLNLQLPDRGASERTNLYQILRGVCTLRWHANTLEILFFAWARRSGEMPLDRVHCILRFIIHGQQMLLLEIMHALAQKISRFTITNILIQLVSDLTCCCWYRAIYLHRSSVFMTWDEKRQQKDIVFLVHWSLVLLLMLNMR